MATSNDILSEADDEFDEVWDRLEESSDENTSSPTNCVTRRSFLAVLGMSTGAASMTAMNVQAAETGYGAGEYGEGGYGDSDEDNPSLSVATDSPTAVTDTVATLNGELTGLDSADAVDVYFEISREKSSTWYMTGRQRLTALNTFSTTIDGLVSDTTYEYRAIVEDEDTRVTGDIVEFATKTAPSNIDPVIDTFEVIDTSSTDPHAELTADWAVSHKGDVLDTVRITVYDEYGLPIAGPEISVSGGQAADTNILTVPYGAGEEYLVTLVVTDTYGNVTIDRELVIASTE